MFKKLMLGMIMCCGAAGAMNNEIEEAVANVVKDPDCYRNIDALVRSVMDSDEKIDIAQDKLENLVTLKDNLKLERIACMLGALSRDLRWYGGTAAVDEYVVGARKGVFGPFDY